MPAIVVTLIAIWALNASIGTWCIMLAIGNIHAIVPAFPALGFWETFSIWVWVAAAFSGTVASRASSK